jgi:hypothetical protein
MFRFLHTQCLGATNNSCSRARTIHARATNLRHAKIFPWHAAFTAVPNLVYFFCPTVVSIPYRTRVYTHTHVQTVYELPWSIFTQIGAVRSADWIFIVGAPVWRWLDQYGPLGRTFYSLLLNRKRQQPSCCLSHFLRRTLLETSYSNYTANSLCNYNCYMH